MTRIDFYVLGEQSRKDPERLVCTLAGKAFASGRKVYIHGSDPGRIRHLDELLWTFRDVSFLPHGLLGEAGPEVPVLLGCEGQPPGHHEVLINHSDEVPEFFSSFERLLEIVGGDPEQRHRARERFRFYRDRGYPLNTHEV